MSKLKHSYVCESCGNEHQKWQGQCSACKAWNSLVEFKQAKTNTQHSNWVGKASGEVGKVKVLSQIELTDKKRITTSIQELDRVLGGGLVLGSVILMGGHPGAGKSTLLLQALGKLAQNQAVLYVTGEESLQQVALRAQRLNIKTDNLKLLAQTGVNAIIEVAELEKPNVLVIDSIQVVHREDIDSAPGSIVQVRESATALTRFAKETQTILFLVGHVTKEGHLAGPKVLEHIVDCSLLLESDHGQRYRTLRSTKNRFGAVNELGIFAMSEGGLKQVKNPSAIFLSRPSQILPGRLVVVIWEGSRSLLVELQALVDDSHLEQPRRVVVGLDYNRLAMLLAVLHRHGGVACGRLDVFVNVVGGLRISETCADLALLIAILSSKQNICLPLDLVVFGEVGLSGEIRPVAHGEERVYEAIKHGFKKIIVPSANVPKKPMDIDIVPVDHLHQAIEYILKLGPTSER